EMHVTAAGAVSFEIAGIFEVGFSRRREVGGATDEPRTFRRDGVEHLAARLARCHALGVGGKLRQRRLPSVRRLARVDTVELLRLLRIFGAVGGEQLAPGFAQLASAPADAVGEMLAYAVRHEEMRVFGPAVILLGEPHLVFAERLTVGRA